MHLASKAIPTQIVNALAKGLTHENHRVKSQCLRGISLLGEHLNSQTVIDIVGLFSDPLLYNTALQTARRLIVLPAIRESLPENIIKTIEEGNLDPSRANSPARKGDMPRIFDKELALQIASSSD